MLDFQLVGGGWGVGGGGEMFTYILDKSCKALSVLLGGVVGEKNSFCTSSSACGIQLAAVKMTHKAPMLKA